MTGEPQVFLEGRPLATIGNYQGLEWSDRLAGGCWEASWDMRVKRNWHHPFTRRGARVELRLGPVCVWCGVLAEPDRDSWRVTARGYSRAAEEYPALNPDGTAATNITVATGQAITRGLPWAAGTLPSWPAHANPVASEEFDGVNTVAALWEAGAEAAGWYWGVGPDRRPYAVPRPTTPTLRCAPGAVVLGVADDEFVTHLAGRYMKVGGGLGTVIRGDSGLAGTPSYRWGRREEVVDLTPRKAMTLATAESILDGMLSRLAPRPGYSNGYEVTHGQIFTTGGTPVHLPLLRSGQVVRLHGVVDDSPHPVPWHDIVIGEIRHTKGGAYIEPLGLADRNLTAVLSGEQTPPLVA